MNNIPEKFQMRENKKYLNKFYYSLLCLIFNFIMFNIKYYIL